MARTWRPIPGLILDPAGSVENIEAQWSSWLGVAVGVLGAYAFPLISAATRLYAGEPREDELRYMVFEAFPLAVVYVVLACLFAFLVCRAFGGRGNLRRYAVLFGWAGLFPVGWAFMGLAVALLGSHIEGSSETTTAALAVAVAVPVMVAFTLVVVWFRFHVAAIAAVFGLSRRRSAIAFVVMALPMFAVYDALL